MCFTNEDVRDWLLITRRGATKQEGVSEVLPLQKGGTEKVLSHA